MTETLGIILPTINECENLKILYPSLRAAFPAAKILVIDDGSTDGTLAYLDQIERNDENLSSFQRGMRFGIGSAHLEGMRNAILQDLTYVLTMDADGTHSVEDAQKLFSSRHASNLIIGSRYLKGASIRGWSLFRILLTYGGHFVTTLAFFSRLDMSSGLRLYRTDEIPLSNLQKNCPPNYEFFFASILVYKKIGLQIHQVPIRLEARGSGESKMTFGLMRRGVYRLFLYTTRIKRIKL
jgi:dolichol-phosphate mannosyltransferase